MKSLKIILFSIFAAAAFILIVSCSGGGSKYDEYGDLDDSDQLPEDTEPVTDTDEVNQDEDQNHTNDNDISDDPGHGGKEDADEIQDETDTTDDNDNETTERDEDSGGESDNDDDVTDTGNQESDSDTEQPDIDEKEDPAVICTDQTDCFSLSGTISCQIPFGESFYGQDAFYASQGYCISKSLSVPSGNDYIVEDLNTGLTWQKKIPDKYNGCSSNDGELCFYEEAVEYCKYLNTQNYGGISDWRLPTPDEFATIIDFSKTPAINPTIFPGTPIQKSHFWAKTTASAQWYVDFSTGKTIVADNTARYVRCVSGEELDKADFSITNPGAEEEIVKDSVHNLLWTRTPNADKLKWKDALNHCAKLKYGGTDQWRLPNINELASVVDYSQQEPASELIKMTPESFWQTSFWSSTSNQSFASEAWNIKFTNGTVGLIRKSKTAAVICVK